MIAGCVQFFPRFGEIEANVATASRLVRGASADLLVLPELCTTGYQVADKDEALSLAETVPGPSVAAFVALAGETGTHLCVGLLEREGDRLLNTAVLLGPEGVLSTYRKSHLFFEEEDVFERGDLGFPVVEVEPLGARLGMLICFDWVFPEAARALALAGADLILHPSNLVLPWCQRAMRTRSLENGVFSLTANRIGEEERAGKKRLAFTGMSQVVSPRGEVLAELGAEEGVAVAEIDPAAARDKMMTERNHLLGDRRPELYRSLTEPGATE